MSQARVSWGVRTRVRGGVAGSVPAETQEINPKRARVRKISRRAAIKRMNIHIWRGVRWHAVVIIGLPMAIIWFECSAASASICLNFCGNSSPRHDGGSLNSQKANVFITFYTVSTAYFIRMGP